MAEMRTAYGQALVELGGENEDIVVLDADLSASTKTSMFREAFPHRHFNAGIAESNMMAAGLAASGKIPFASTFAMFGTARPYEVIRNLICHPNLNVKIACTHAGVTVGEDGATHQAIEDIAIMRALPNMRIYVPADAAQTTALVKKAAQEKGPTYIRMVRSACKDVYEEGEPALTKAADVLKEGAHISLFACGIMVEKALSAADALKEKGIEAEVINVAQIKPLDEEVLIASAKKTGAVICCEEHSVIGGLSSAVAELLAQKHPVKMAFVGIDDRFGQSGKPDELLKEYQLTEIAIESKAQSLLNK